MGNRPTSTATSTSTATATNLVKIKTTKLKTQLEEARIKLLNEGSLQEYTALVLFVSTTKPYASNYTVWNAWSVCEQSSFSGTKYTIQDHVQLLGLQDWCELRFTYTQIHELVYLMHWQEIRDAASSEEALIEAALSEAALSEAAVSEAAVSEEASSAATVKTPEKER